MAEVVGLRLDVQSGQASRSIKDVRQEIKALQSELLNAETGSEQFNRALAQIAERKDELKEINEQVAALDPGAKAQQFQKLGTAIAGGFSVATGAAALFGAENEDISKALLKVQSATAVLQGVQALADTAKQAGLVKNVILLNLESAAQSKNTVVKVAATVAQRALNAAMNANPIFLIITGVLALVAAYKLFAGSAKKSAEEQERLNERTKEFLNLSKTLDQTLEEQRISRIENVTEKEIASLRLREQEQINSAKKQLENIKLTNRQREELQKKVDDIILGIRIETDEKIAKLRRDARNKENQEQQKDVEAEKAANQKRLDAQRVNQQREILITKEGIDQRLALFDLETKAQLKQAKERGENLNLLTQLRQKERADIIEKERLEQIKRQDELDEIEFQAFTSNLLAKEKAEKEAEQERENERKRILEEEKKRAELRIQIEQDIFNALNSLNEIFLGQSKAAQATSKAIALAQIGVDTARAISALVANSEANPANAFTAGLAGVAQFVSGIARITANIAKAKQLLGGGGPALPSATAGATVPAIAAPAIASPTIIQQTNLQQQPQQPQEIKVFVTESDISQTQNRVNTINVRAKVK